MSRELAGASNVIAPMAALSSKVFAYKGNTATKLANPGRRKTLNIQVETGTVRIKAGNHAGVTFTVPDHTNDKCNAVGHGFLTGDGPMEATNSGGGLPTGVAASTPLWAIKVDNDNFKLATSEDNATAGTAIDITSAGTGTNKIGGPMVGTAPGASIANGIASVALPATPIPYVFAAGDAVTVCGVDANAVCTYWWT